LEDECPAERKERDIKLQITNVKKDFVKIDIRKKVNK
jgi:hypothetical protein